MAAKKDDKKGNTKHEHRVVRFGSIYYGYTYEEGETYQFTHQRLDGMVTRGYIPVDYLAAIQVDGASDLYFRTKQGEAGPEYQFAWQSAKNVVGDWSSDLDALWAKVLMFMEKKGLASEEALDYLDADPYVIFGIDDPVTQKALYELQSHDVLVCEGATPSLAEWFSYLNADPEVDSGMSWVVEAFAEAELPPPWISYKGWGSIVCFRNTAVNMDSAAATPGAGATWKHPLYDYFLNLLEYCREANIEEVRRLRVHRLLWNFYTYVANTDAESDPLISPSHVRMLGAIFEYKDLAAQSWQVRPLKASLKYFATEYGRKREIHREDILYVTETLKLEDEKHDVMTRTWRETLQGLNFSLDDLVDGKLTCAETGEVALIFCFECKEPFCFPGYDKLHQKGRRADHVHFRTRPCNCYVDEVTGSQLDVATRKKLCGGKEGPCRMPAKLECKYTNTDLCTVCFAMIHVKKLPPEAREVKPQKIDYAKQLQDTLAQITYGKPPEGSRPGTREVSSRPGTQDSTTSGIGTLGADEIARVLGSDWHQFYDRTGICFYYNFLTDESYRTPPQATQDELAKAAEIEAMFSKPPPPIQPPREIRPPYRTHSNAELDHSTTFQVPSMAKSKLPTT
jgi:hypothetical protein